MSTKEMNLKSKIINPTLSLCMIVKNEEKFLPMCLDSVKDYVDEIIIVDTGSTDNTVKIAKSYNAKVYHHPWENSFSKARNYSLKYATCDWILILDADEEIDKNDAHKLREVIKDPVGCDTTHRVSLIFLPVLDKVVGGGNKTICNSERMFKNNLGFQYQGIVHNSLKYSGQTKNFNIKIYHYGYTQGEEQMERKFVRTSTLLKEQIRNDPDNPLPHHYLAISSLDRNMNDECLQEALEAIRLFELHDSKEQIRLLSYYTASVAFYRKDDLCNAETYALQALEFYPGYLDAYCILSSIYFRQKEQEKCIKVARKYLSLLESIKVDPSTALIIPYNTIQHAWLVHIRIATINFIQGKEDEGIQALKSAIKCVENKWEPYLSVGKYFFEQRDYEMAERFFKDGLMFDSKNKSILRYLAETYEKKGLLNKAIVHFKKILEEYPDEISVQYRLGLLHLNENRFDEAINSFKSVISNDPKHIEALFHQAVAYERMGENNQAKYIYKDVLTKKPDFVEVLVRLGSLYLNEGNYTDAKECFLSTLSFKKYLMEAHLALSKIYISQSDIERCVKSCEELLKSLNLPRNGTIDNMSDLSGLYVNIGKALMDQQLGTLANFSFEISALLNPK